MTECPHGCGEARHVATVLRLPWAPGIPATVDVEHRCERYGCPSRGTAWLERATYPQKVLDRAMEAQGFARNPPGANGAGVPSAFKGCLPECRYYESHARNGIGGATVVHANGCIWLRMPA